MKSATIGIVTCLLMLIALNAYPESSELTGTWTLDIELTEKLQPPIKKNRGVSQGLRGFIAGGGVIAPVPGGGAPSSGAAALKTPIILECTDLTLDKNTSKITVECANGTRREFNEGKVHGRNTKFKRNRLTESYSSTSRSVRHNLKLDRDGNLIATVTIQPKGGISQRYVRAFNRKQEELPEPSETEVTLSESS